MADLIKTSIKRTTTAVKATSNFTYGSGSFPAPANKTPAKKRDVKQADSDKRSQSDALAVFNINDAVDPTQLDGGNSVDKTPGTTQPIGYKFNLPPHEWSLPVRPRRVNATVADTDASINPYNGMSKDDINKSGNYLYNKDAASFHGLRRGRIWTFKDLNYSLGADTTSQSSGGTGGLTYAGRLGATSLTGKILDGLGLGLLTYVGGVVKDAAGKVVNVGSSVTRALEITGRKDAEAASATSTGIGLSADTKYGFQFLWNPESVSNSVSLSQSVTPSATDVFRASAGIFLSQETVSINLIIDRTNDFACVKGTDSEIDGKTFKNKDFEKYYKNRYPFEAQQDFNDQITKLVKLGTMSDIEYLYKSINGPGLGSGKDAKNWANLLGKETADIGFLTPRIIAIQFGPDINAISYVGQAMSLSVNHIAFTETMIPIRSQVTLNLMVFSGYGSTAQG